MQVRIYHNPRCSKSRQALQLLREHGIEPEVVEYLNTPPGWQELDQLLGMLGGEPRDLLRTGEPEYQAAGLDDAALPRDAVLQALQAHPRLLQRPIVVRGERAVIGRPPERVLELLRE